MAYHRLMKPRYLVFIPLLLLIIAVACGEDATSTPQPTATTAATAVPPTATPTTAAMQPTTAPTTAAATATPRPTPKPGEPTATSAPPSPTPEPTATKAAKPTSAPTPTPTAAPLPTPTPGFVTSTVDRLLLAQSPAGYETNLPWLFPSVDSQLRPMYELLVSTDLTGLLYEPQLSTKWEMRPDGRAWTFDLQENVPWHFGFGEFTAADVVHAWERVTGETSIASDVGIWRTLVDSAEDIEIVNDHQVVFNLTRPEPDMEYHVSTKLGGLYMTSAAQWDAVGDDGVNDNPAGTGPYRYVERRFGESILYERVEAHWRRTPDFKQLLMRFVAENATKLAMILTGEAHIAEIPRDLHPQVLNQGKRVINAAQTGVPAPLFFGGLYFATPDKLDNTLPFVDIRVREAMTRAIDRETIIDTIFSGGARPAYQHYLLPGFPGWDPSWDERGPDLYGFDPDRSRELLADAGFSDGFDMTILLQPWAGYGEFIPVGEALAAMWQDVGINVNIVEMEFARVREQYRDKDIHGKVFGWLPSNPRPPQFGLKVVYYSKEGGISFSYENIFVDDRIDELDQTIDMETRDRLLREIGEHLFVNYASMPLFYVPIQAVIDPEVVADYPLPGTLVGYSHLEFVVAAKTQ